MATSYQDIYERFLPKITNYSFINLTQEELENNLETYLKSAIVKFRYCKKLSDRDENLKMFLQDLNDEEKEILAYLMCVEYLNPKILTDELLQQKLSSKDYQIYSQANQIKEIREVRDLFKKESTQLIMRYSYGTIKADDFK